MKTKLYTLTQLTERGNKEAIQIAQDHLLEEIRFDEVNQEDIEIHFSDLNDYISDKLEGLGIFVRDISSESYYGVSLKIDAEFNEYSFSKNPSQNYLQSRRYSFIKKTIGKKLEELSREEQDSVNKKADEYIESIIKDDFFANIISDEEQELLDLIEEILDIHYEAYIYDGSYLFYLEASNSIQDANYPVYTLLESLKQVDSEIFAKYELVFLLADEDEEDSSLEIYRDEVEEFLTEHLNKVEDSITNKGVQRAQMIFDEVKSYYIDLYKYFDGDQYWIDRIENADIYDFEEYLFTEKGEFVCKEEDLDYIQIKIEGSWHSTDDFQLETPSL